MSEKRFRPSDPNILGPPSLVLVWDSEKYHHMNHNEILDVLNSLNDDNMQLKKLLQEAEEEINKLKKSNKLLMESHIDQESED